MTREGSGVREREVSESWVHPGRDVYVGLRGVVRPGGEGVSGPLFRSQGTTWGTCVEGLLLYD